jgi:hypothetical protein
LAVEDRSNDFLVCGCVDVCVCVCWGGGGRRVSKGYILEEAQLTWNSTLECLHRVTNESLQLMGDMLSPIANPRNSDQHFGDLRSLHVE